MQFVENQSPMVIYGVAAALPAYLNYSAQPSSGTNKAITADVSAIGSAGVGGLVAFGLLAYGGQSKLIALVGGSVAGWMGGSMLAQVIANNMS